MLLVLGSWAAPARAVELAKVDGKPVSVDVTETAIGTQRFAARTAEGELPNDNGWGAFINKLNVLLKWDKLTLGTRLDASLYWLRPEDRDFADPREKKNAVADGASRFRDTVYPAKLWLTYKRPGIEVTAGDAYVQLGRGLVLSARKLDELGVDTTIFGGKAVVQHDPFQVVLVAGFANPTRIDEASGRALYLPRPIAGDAKSAQPLYGSDRIVGAEIQSGRGLPLVLGSRIARLTRCAPYQYDAAGKVVGGGVFDAPLGSCAPDDTQAWMASVSSVASPVASSTEVVVASQSVEIPSLWKHGSLYVEGAVQRRALDDPRQADTQGNAIYGVLATSFGNVNNTLEVKSYRSFYPLSAAINGTRAGAFSALAYSALPTTEPITQDAMFGSFNACVDGGRLRTDVRIRQRLLVYGALGYYRTKSEVPGGGCDAAGRFRGAKADEMQTVVHDVTTGFEWRFDNDQSWVFASTNARNDVKDSDHPFYREGSMQFLVNKQISGPYAAEVVGRHRLRWQEGENLQTGTAEAYWREGETYTSLKIAPTWVFTQGFEYTTRAGFPTYYLNGSLLYRITPNDNVKLLVGQQRGGLKCVSGVCRIFPAFEGIRAELTLRF